MKSPNVVQHGQLIAMAAKESLSPIGMKRRGKSRIWLKDNRWWLAVVEFQPSSWGKGTYLNVAAMWLWYPHEHLAFDESKRIGGFVEFEDPQSFASAAHDLATMAADEVLEMCRRFATVSEVAAHLRKKPVGNPWNHYNSMMASLANADLAHARLQHAALSRTTEHAPWVVTLKAKAAELMARVSDEVEARTVTSAEIHVARKLHNLPEIDDKYVWEIVP